MSADFGAGSLVGPYRLDAAIGRGGFGTVWRARHAQTGQVVALKILSGQYASGDSPRIRAEVELLAGAALTSRHVVRVLDGGIDPTPFVVMEYVEGEDLAAELARRGSLPQGDVLAIARAVAEALQDLERAGIIHRDIKPSNVIRSSDGPIKVADFGIAKILGFDQVTAAGHSPMSLAYAAPEAWEGNTSHLTDIYGLGALLYQCLTGRAPFVGTPAEILNQHRSERPDLDLLPPDTVPALRGLIASCLAKEPDERPPGADDVLERIALADRQRREFANDPDRSLRPPIRFGPWTRQSAHPTDPWAFRCIDERTGARATVEIYASENLALGDTLLRAVESNPALVPFGAERLLGTSRLMLRPGEGWPAFKAPFLFWVARDEREASTMAAQLSRTDVSRAVSGFLTLVDAAATAGVPLRPSAADLGFDAGRITLRRPGLLTRGGEPGGLDLVVELLRGLPLDSATRTSLAPARTLDDLRRWRANSNDPSRFGVAREAADRATPSPHPGNAGQDDLVSSAGIEPPDKRTSLDARAVAPGAPAPASAGREPPPRLPIDRAANADGGGRGRLYLLGGGVAAAMLAAGAGAFLLLSGGGDQDDNAAKLQPVKTVTNVVTTVAPGRTATKTAVPTGTARATSTPTLTTTPGTPQAITVVSPPPSGGVVAPYTQFVAVVVRDVTLEWKFDGAAGQLVEFRSDRDPTGDVHPRITVIDPSGREIADEHDQSRGWVRVAVRLGSTGEFRVKLSGRGGAGPASVRFVVDPFSAIEIGKVTAASLELPGELDRYTFPGEPEQLAEVRIVRDPGAPISPRIRIRNPFNDEILSDYDSYHSGYIVRTIRLKDSGVFTVETYASEDATGAYTIEVNIDPYLPYAIGQTVTGQLRKPVERHRYKFACTAGRRINISVTPDPSGAVTPKFELSDPFGRDAYSDYSSYEGRAVQRDLTCEYTGDYVIAVRATKDTAHGGYTLLIQ